MLNIDLYGEDESCADPRDVLPELERLTGTTLEGFGPDAWVFKAPRRDGGPDPLLTVHGFDTSREWRTLREPKLHVSAPLLPRTVPDEVDEVQRFCNGLQIKAFDDLDTADTAALVRIVTTLVDTFELQVADDWMHLVRREWLEDYLVGEVSLLIDGTPRRELQRSATIWRFGDELFGLPSHQAGWFILDGTELCRTAVDADGVVGAFATSVVDLSRHDDPMPDTSTRFPDGEKLVLKAARCKTMTAFYERARRVAVSVFDATWLIQPLLNQGPRKPWYVDQRTDPPYGLRDPSPAEIGNTILTALYHFDSTPATH